MIIIDPLVDYSFIHSFVRSLIKDINTEEAGYDKLIYCTKVSGLHTYNFNHNYDFP